MSEEYKSTNMGVPPDEVVDHGSFQHKQCLTCLRDKESQIARLQAENDGLRKKIEQGPRVSISTDTKVLAQYLEINEKLEAEITELRGKLAEAEKKDLEAFEALGAECEESQAKLQQSEASAAAMREFIESNTSKCTGEDEFYAGGLCARCKALSSSSGQQIVEENRRKTKALERAREMICAEYCSTSHIYHDFIDEALSPTKAGEEETK